MVTAGGQAAAASTSRPGHTVIHSLNWAGYAANRAGTTFRSVSAAFSCRMWTARPAPASYSSHWVGLDGLGSASVEQAGIEADCSGSTAQYYAWYEMYPKPVSVAFQVRAGNAIEASVSYKRSARKFVLTLRDYTNGRHFSRTLKCAAKACIRSSAEVISEAPSNGSGGILPLADYRAASYSSITLTTSQGTPQRPELPVLEHVPDRRGGRLQPRAGGPAHRAVPRAGVQHLLVPGELTCPAWFRAG